MKTILLMICVGVSASAFGGTKTAVYTDIIGEKTVQISYEVQSEDENEVVVANPKVTLDSKEYYMFGPGGSGYGLCRALGYLDEKGNALTQRDSTGEHPELIWIDMQGGVSIVKLPLKLHTAICVKKFN